MAFNTDGMANALGDVTDKPAAPTIPPNRETDPEKIGQLRSMGWVKPQAYNYDDVAAGGDPAADAEGDTDLRAGKWAHDAARYEWKEEYGDVGPVVPELERELFESEWANRVGDKFNQILKVKVVAEAEERPEPIRSYKQCGLHPVMVENVDKCRYEIPTPIQAYTIPAVLKGHDIIATAQTGSGKTAAYLIPTISKLMGKARKIAAPRPFNTESANYTPVRAEPLVLVVAPTRELCCQIFDEARRLCYRSMLRPCIAYGGAPAREQRVELGKGCDVLIATPGRLLDFMNDTRVLSLSRLRFTIIDEADEMLHDDWGDEMAKIMGGADANQSGNHQYLLFSATFNKTMRKLAKRFLSTDHVRIRIGRQGAVHDGVLQSVIQVDRSQKQQALYDLLVSAPPARTMVFVRSKKSADFVDDFLFNNGLPSTSIHADRTQREREDAIRAFAHGKAPILVTTGVAARGLDIKHVMHIINFDLPSVDHGGEAEYVHRIGRTARIGHQGLATSFYYHDDDMGLAPFLAKTLVECKQPVPDFLAEFAPPATGEAIDWNDDSGAEDEEEKTAANGQADDDGWGGDNTATAVPASTNDAWGTAQTNTATSDGW